jgi:hypothetical protein
VAGLLICFSIREWPPEACSLYGNLNRVTSRGSNLFNLGGSVAFELHLCMLRVAERWQLMSPRVADRLPDTGFG